MSRSLLRAPATVVAACVLGIAATRCPADERPNILWISVEDISPNLGCYGDPDAKTPTLDALAARGIRYTNVFTTCPVCATNRSSIITGVYPTTIGTQHMRCQAQLPDDVRCFTESLREAGYYCSNNVKEDYNFQRPEGAWDESSDSAHWRNREPGQPFFAVFNNTVTHESKIWRRGEHHKELTPDLTAEDRIDPDGVSPPPYYPNTPETRLDWATYLEDITQADYWAKSILEQLREDGLADDTIVFFWSDHGVGLPRGKRFPYDSGLHVPLIVYAPERFRTKGMPRHGSTSSELVGFVDLAPTVLKLAGIEPVSRLQGRAFLGDDLTAPRQYAYSVRDRMDERYDLIRSIRDKRYRYLRNYMPWKPYAQRISFAEENETMRALRRLDASGKLPAASQAFMAERKAPEELYDLEADPHELNNLAEDPAHRKTLKRFRDALAEWQAETGDLGLIPEPLLREREAQLGDCPSILDIDHYEGALARVRALLAPDLGSDERVRQATAAATSDDPIERYWACELLRDASSGKGVLANLLSDPSEVVRVVAAQGVLDFASDDDAAVDVLLAALASEKPWVRLYAVNALDDALPASPKVVGALDSALQDDNVYVVRVAEWALHRLDGRPLPNLWRQWEKPADP